jgi:CRISPR-associated exonuclease Cas4
MPNENPLQFGDRDGPGSVIPNENRPHPLDEDSYLSIHLLNDLLFCERRAALHLIEGIWRDNQYTIEGSYAHRNVDVEANLKRGDKRNVTGMWLVSHRLGLVGKADLVEFRSKSCDGALAHDVAEVMLEEGGGGTESRPAAPPYRSTVPITTAETPIPYPVDFKRGKKRRWDNNEVQLCAQAMCLEEMLGVQVPRGAIFHIKSQRREEVAFDDVLRTKTENAARRLRALFESRKTPSAKYHAKCKGCSLFEWCMPKALRPRATAKRYLETLVAEDLRDS